MYRNLLLIAGILLLANGCSLFDSNKQEEPLARVFEEYLYPSDLSEAITPGTSSQDSLVIAKRFVETWVKDQLMLSRAEQALSEEQMDFEKQIEQYRLSLLIFSYRQKLLQQKLDTLVTEEEIQTYYEENVNNFMLNQDVIKGTFIKIPLSAPRVDELRRWSWNSRPKDLEQMEKYCISYADKFSDFNDSWVYFNSIKVQLPMKISQPSRYLSYNKNIETRDSQFRYFLHVTDLVTEGEAAPLELVSEDIISIILNKRKMEFIQDLEQRVYNDGVNRNQFEIYQ
jgi:hypothetical protein